MQPKGRRCVSHETGKRHLQSHTRSPPPSQQYPPGKHPQPVGTHPAPEQRCARRVRYAGRALPAGTQLCCQSCSETIMHLLLSQNGKKKTQNKKTTTKQDPTLPFQKVALRLLYSPSSGIIYLTRAQWWVLSPGATRQFLSTAAQTAGCCGRQALAACRTAMPPFTITQTREANKYCIEVRLQQLIQ